MPVVISHGSGEPETSTGAVRSWPVAWIQNARPVCQSTVICGSTVFHSEVNCSSDGYESAQSAPSSVERVREFSVWAGE